MGKPEYPEKNLSVQSREPTNSTHIWRQVWESNPGHIGGGQVLSPLRHPFTPKLNWQLMIYLVGHSNQRQGNSIISLVNNRFSAHLFFRQVFPVYSQFTGSRRLFCKLRHYKEPITQSWVLVFLINPSLQLPNMVILRPTQNRLFQGTGVGPGALIGFLQLYVPGTSWVRTPDGPTLRVLH